MTTSSGWAAPSAGWSSTATRSTSPTRSPAPMPFRTRPWRAPCASRATLAWRAPGDNPASCAATLCAAQESTGSLPENQETVRWKGAPRAPPGGAGRQARVCGVPSSRLHFLDLPFYYTDPGRRRQLGPRDEAIMGDSARRRPAPSHSRRGRPRRSPRNGTGCACARCATRWRRRRQEPWVRADRAPGFTCGAARMVRGPIDRPGQSR